MTAQEPCASAPGPVCEVCMKPVDPMAEYQHVIGAVAWRGHKDCVMNVGAGTPERRRQFRWFFRLKWEPRDIWLGVYWTRPESFAGYPPHLRSRTWYVCLVPCLPIIITRQERLR